MGDEEAGPSSSGHSSPTSNTSTTPPPPTQPPPPPPHPQACAACKHQRRRCTPECRLARYFPADQPVRFRNAHRLFGIKNILRVMASASEELRDDAMKSVVYESDAWVLDPVGGAAGIVKGLSQELARVKAELDAVKRLIELHRRAAAQQQQQPPVAVASNGGFLPSPPPPQEQQPLFLPPPPPTMMLQDGHYDDETVEDDYLVDPPAMLLRRRRRRRNAMGMDMRLLPTSRKKATSTLPPLVSPPISMAQPWRPFVADISPVAVADVDDPPGACAACAHLGRACPPGCPLARCFPAAGDQPAGGQLFRNAFRLFGVGNVVGFLLAAGGDPGKRRDAVASVAYEADARADDPVRGAHGVVMDLERQLDCLKAELATAQSALARHRQYAQPPPPPPNALDRARALNYFCHGCCGDVDGAA
uniref:LOB domain-containing protein n=1 Tax=Oryza meridionalis TaxID=40149 RepID=A0A0E0C3R7_9ORYZ